MAPPLLVTGGLERALVTSQSLVSPPQDAETSFPWRSLLLVALPALAIWAVVLPATIAHDPWTFSWDTAAYLETANSLHDGRGLSHRAIHGIGPEIWEPLTLWPPGYPFLIAAVMLLGVPATTASLVVSIGCAAIAIVLLSLISLRFVKWHVAAPLVAAIAASTAFQSISAQTLSDSAYYMWTLASVFCMLEWTRRGAAGWRWLFAAGVFAGAGWLTRNVALALFLATGLFLLMQLVWRRLADVVKAGAIWAAGAAILVVPLLIRNIVEFGSLNPYYQPPSKVSLGENLQLAMEVVARDLTTSDFVATVSEFAVASVIVLAGVALWLLAKRHGLRAIPELARRQGPLLFVLCYAALYFVMVVVARSTYNWGEQISSRYMAQMYWPLWLGIGVGVAGLLAWLKVDAKRSAIALTAVFALVLALNVRENVWKLTTPPPESASDLRGVFDAQTCDYLREQVGEGQIVLAANADILRNHCNVNARKLQSAAAYDDLRRPIEHAAMLEAGRNGLLWGVVVDDIEAFRRGDFGPLFQDMLDHPGRHAAFSPVMSGDRVILLKFVGTETP